MVEGPGGARLLAGKVAALKEVPHVEIPANEFDSQYQTLGWQAAAARTAMQRAATSGGWLQVL